MRLQREKVVIAFEWRGVKRKNVIDSRVSDFKNQRVASCIEGMKERRIENVLRISIMAFFIEVFENVHRIRGNVTMVTHGYGLRDFLRRKRGYEMREGRKNVSLNVALQKPKWLEILSLVDEAIGESLR